MGKRSNWQDFQSILNQHHIKKLYHFTDRENLQSIINNDGLYSWADCEEKGIVIAKPGGGWPSRDLDKRHGLEHYVRLSFTKRHPMMFVAQDDGRINDPVILEINPEILFEEDTLFSDKNAASNDAHVGGTLDDFKMIHFKSLKAKKHFDLEENERPYFQAEILVQNFVPLSYITNIESFGIPIEHQIPDEETLTTEVTKVDLDNGIKDEFGAIYSPDGKRLLKGPKDVSHYSVRQGTIIISDQAFNGFEKIREVEIPNSTTHLGDEAFCGCIKLNLISWPKSVIYIGNEPQGMKYVGNRAFYKCNSIESFSLPDSVIQIGDEAFCDCISLKTIILSYKINHIGKNVFKGCSVLSKIIIPD